MTATVPTFSQLRLPPDRDASIQERYEAFAAANPHVYRRLVQLARDLVARGHRKVGMKMLFEVLRWEHAMTTDDPTSDFKLNNDYTSRYARDIMDAEPDLDGVFEIRRLTA